MKVIRRFINTLREGFKGIWKHKHLGFVSVTSTFFTLFVIGVIILITVTINNMAHQIQDKVNDVEIFLNNDVTELDRKKVREELDKLDYRKTIKYRSSEEALELMKKSWGENADLLENINSEGLLPSSFIVKLQNIGEVEDFISSLEQNTIIKTSTEEVKYYKDLVDQVYTTSNYVKIFGIVLVIVLMVVSFFVISNTIKLTVMSRINEIAVMKYVGATNGYIRVPFIIEGMFFGIIASILAYLAVYYSYDYVFYNFGRKISENIALVNLINPELIQLSLIQIFLALGLGIGVLGSIFSIRKYLHNKEVKYVK